MTGTRDLFTISLYLLTCLAAAMLAGAEGSWLLPAALTPPIAVAAYALVERRRVTIPTYVANGLGLAAFAASLLELAVRDVEGRILFGAHLLVYLSWIVLWQPKGPQQRWGLIALAVLQVAVGGVLTNAGTYGITMAAFLVLGVWTLVLLQLASAEDRYAPTVAAATPPTGASILLAPGSVATVGQAALGQWPTRQIVAAVGVTVAGAVVVGGAFFLLVPRFEVTRYAFDETLAPLARQRVTGFTERVRLGAFGEILESNVMVFEVRVYDVDGRMIPVEDYAARLGLDEPLFRGLTLSDYESGEWTTGSRGQTSPLRGRPLPDSVRQEYRLQPLSSDVLFAIAPVHAGRVVGSDDPIRRRYESQTLIRPSRQSGRAALSYEVYSPTSAAAAERERQWQTIREWWNDEQETMRPYLELPEELSHVRDLAAEVARPDDRAATRERRAERLLAHLRDTGGFRYTLSGELIDPRLDPVEDFLVNRKSGHCEYFASALALMLRAEGVPSRVVSGFKGGVRNRLSGAFEVQQRHAHAWVEAYLGERWVTLDPSPAAGRNETVAAGAPPVPLWNDMRSAAAVFWRDYVVQMNLSRQRQTLAPLREAAAVAAASWQNEWWPALKQQAYALATDPSRWFSWQGGVATFLGLLIFVAIWRIGRRLMRRLARFRAKRAAQVRRGRRVEFYERFRRLCGRRGWNPSLGQTPREFALDVAAKIATRPQASRLTDLPQELTEDFYQVRFGDIDLSEPRTNELEARLTELETALAGERGASAPRVFERR